MTTTHPNRTPRPLRAMLIFVGLMLLAGCGNQTQPLTVDPFMVPEKAELDAELVVKTMRQAGFSDEQILDHGPACRNALATAGGVRMRDKEFTLAMFMIRSNEVYGVAVNRGAFHFPLDGASHDSDN